MNWITKLLVTAAIWIGFTGFAFAVEPVYSDFFGKAIRGYDPVAYFT